MRRFVWVMVVLGLVMSMGAKLMTEDQSKVSGVLEALKLEFVPDKDGRIGGPMDYKVTDATLQYLKGKTFVLGNDGSVKVKP